MIRHCLISGSYIIESIAPTYNWSLSQGLLFRTVLDTSNNPDLIVEPPAAQISEENGTPKHLCCQISALQGSYHGQSFLFTMAYRKFHHKTNAVERPAHPKRLQEGKMIMNCHSTTTSSYTLTTKASRTSTVHPSYGPYERKFPPFSPPSSSGSSR